MLNNKGNTKRKSIMGSFVSLSLILSFLLFAGSFIFMATWDMPQPKNKVTKLISNN